MNNAVLTYKSLTEDSGKSVETICKNKLHISSGLITQLKREGKIFIDGTPCRSIDIVRAGSIVSADVTETGYSENIVATPMKLDILYDDEFITVVNKPRKMSVHPCPQSYENTLANGIVHFWSSNGEAHKFHAVNRLDKDTSGICVIAKNRFAHSFLCRKALFKKKYKAVVCGILEEKQGTISLPIKRAEDSIIKRIIAPDGKESITHYKVIAEKDDLSLMDIQLETGRTHQIRVHFSAIGHPLVHDWLYGDDSSDDGHLLHVYEIRINHPATNQQMIFSSPIPKDMSALFTD